jgi:uncharacterized protein (DUF362 family)
VFWDLEVSVLLLVGFAGERLIWWVVFVCFGVFLVEKVDGEVFLVKTSDRAFGVGRLFGVFDLGGFRGERVALKANFNSADPFPASTHLETLGAVVGVLKGAGVERVVLAERSGMGVTRRVLEEMGVFGLGERLGFDVVVLDELPKSEWVAVRRVGSHWLNGFCVAKCFLDAGRVVQVCCLKTHRFGGHFTLSLKNGVGLVAKRLPGEVYDYMWELHSSPFQRQMIAEINLHYRVDVVVMDGVRAFVSGGPERGDVVEPNLMLASRDRVALDAVGVAILRLYGATGHVAKGRIFELDQIRRAAELGVGVKSAREIRLKPLNDECKADVEKIEQVLAADG